MKTMIIISDCIKRLP